MASHKQYLLRRNCFQHISRALLPLQLAPEAIIISMEGTWTDIFGWYWDESAESILTLARTRPKNCLQRPWLNVSFTRSFHCASSQKFVSLITLSSVYFLVNMLFPHEAFTIYIPTLGRTIPWLLENPLWMDDVWNQFSFRRRNISLSLLIYYPNMLPSFL